MLGTQMYDENDGGPGELTFSNVAGVFQVDSGAGGTFPTNSTTDIVDFLEVFIGMNILSTRARNHGL